MALTTLILLADIGDVLSSLAPIIFVILYGIAHLVGNLQQEKRKPPVRPRPAQPPQDFRGAGAGAGNAAAGNPTTLEETLRREVEEFLRRAQGQPQQHQQPQQAQRPQQRSQQRPQQGRQDRQRPSLAPSRGGRQPERTADRPDQVRRLVGTPRSEVTPTGVEPLRSEPLTTTVVAEPMGAGIARHVAEHLSTQALVQHTQQLGSDVAAADSRMQDHVRQKFDHQLGALAPRTSLQQQGGGSPAAQQLRALLSRPEGVRQVIIASEILRRPDERWVG
jgi:hypothetical protein